MPEVSVQIANRTYELACGEGEEARVQELAADHVARRQDEPQGQRRGLIAASMQRALREPPPVPTLAAGRNSARCVVRI